MNNQLTLIESRLRPWQSGFSMLELMIALSVLGILIGIGVPSFTNMVRENAISSQSSTLVQTFALARSEASKRGLQVSVCPIAGGNATVCTADWSTGWMIFEDDAGTTGVFDSPGDITLQVYPDPGTGVTITTAATAVTYLPSAAVATMQTFDITKNGCTGDQKRRLVVATTGRAGLTRVACN